ncbi:MAG: hypothetical protein L6408_05845 [Nanoarchaeota archaeon]|nr:hypothetical protein [Nanoarchaeota archaeon]
MNFKNYIRNEYGRCDTPENTIRRIQEGLQKVGVDIEWVLSQQFSDSLFWTKLHSPSIGLISYGKGISPQLSKASALAEFVERLSEPGEWVSGLYLGLTLSGRIRNFEWVKGHLNQH